MPKFETPTPIDLAINLPVGAISVIASDRKDTVVTVEPTNPDKAVDRRGAEQTKVEFDGQRLTITGPKHFTIIGPSESVDLIVELPTGSRLTAELSVGAIKTSGTLGATRVKASTGAADLDATGDLWLRAGHGHAAVKSADGDVEITADHGKIRVGSVTGNALLKASHGDVELGEVGGDAEVKLSYGDLEIGTARSNVTAKTAYGSIQLGEVSAGEIDLQSGYGAITIGVKAKTPAWLDLRSKEGRVRNELEAEGAPTDKEQAVTVRARTQFGDITITKGTK